MKEIWSYFGKLGCLGFGGPLALVGEMQQELVEKRRWISPEDFHHAFALIKAMPGPLAYQTAVFLGRHRAGTLGGLSAGLALVLPSFLLMLLFGLFFDRFSQSPLIEAFLFGMQASALGVIVASLRGLVRPYFRHLIFWALLLGALPFCLRFNAWEPAIILGFGLVAILARQLPHLISRRVWGVGDVSLLVGVCFKAGALVFGTGLAIVPLLEFDVVTKYHWLTQNSFMNALAFGQVTPGPVVITATFIGYKVAGFVGATLATIAIFAPSTFHMLTWFPIFITRLSKQAWITSFILGAVAAVVASLVVTVGRLGFEIHLGVVGVSIAIGSLVLSMRQLLPTWSVIPISGITVMALRMGGWF